MLKTRTLMVLCTALAALAILPAAGQAKTAHRACVVPKLTGDQLATARKRLTAAHCAVGTIHNPHAAKGAKLIVSATNPRAGRREPNGKRVGLTFKAEPAKTISAPSSSTTTTVTPTVTTPTVTTPPVTTSAPPTTTRASIDPSYTQNPANPLQVTWAYSAAANGGSLPDGTLSLTVYQSGQVGSAGGCSMNVGDGVNGGNCTVTLPAYGPYQVTVTYDGSDPSVAPATSTDTETISNPNSPTTPPAPTQTAISAAVTSSTTTQYVGPPPTYLQATDTDDAITATSSDPDSSQTCTWTVTDTTTGQAVTDSTTSCAPYGLDFEQDAGSDTVMINASNTFAGLSFNQADTVTVTVATSGSSGYTAATSTPVTVWPTS